MDITARFQYFNHWTDQQRRECFARAKLRQFEPEETIFVEGRAPINFVHLVLSGKCMVLQCLKMTKSITKNGTIKYRLASAHPIEDEITQLHRRRSSRMVDLERTPMMTTSKQPSQSVKYEYHFVDVASYACGSVFGVGEHMDDRTVVARGRVQCLMIPRYWLMQKSQNVNNVWSRIRIFLEQQQPSREQLFEWFLNELHWQKYRRKLRTSFTGRHVMANKTGIWDVPLLCRIEQGDVFS
ncbi:uncharacterized protein LOC128746071 [Sabethes cyaneus]|uniref:uncharacterized protein LOC128746071 n=1 Tax=Sabethes cyaneus TaxID=53552 RepID=UPI00237DC13E|nr:uncharacterized protein LOC128746071 [Sabethes cyaneus]